MVNQNYTESTNEEIKLTIENFKGIKNTPENRKKFHECPFTVLYIIKKEAVEKEFYEIAAFIRDVINDMKKNKADNEAGEKALDNTTSAHSEVTEKCSSSLGNTLNESHESEEEQFNWEFINSRRTKIIVASMLFKHVWDNDNTSIYPNSLNIDVRDEYWNKIYVTPETIKEHQATIIVQWCRIRGSNEARFFVMKNWQFKEVSLIPDRRLGDSKIEEIVQVWDYYRVTLRSVNNLEKTERLHFIVDYNGNYVKELWPQSWKERFKFCPNDFSWAYQYKKYLENEETYYYMFNSKMEKLAEYNSDWNPEYYDDNVCVCFSKELWSSQKYRVFYKNELIQEWLVCNLKPDLEWNNLMTGYFNQREEKLGQKPEGGEKKKCNCEVIYDDKDRTLSIINNDKRVLRSFWGVVKHGKNDYYIDQYSKKYKIELLNEKNGSKLLGIRIKNNEENQTLIINKETWELLSKLEWEEAKYCRIIWNLVQVYYNGNSNKSRIYNHEFTYLWDSIDDNRDTFHWVQKEEDGVKKYYVVSSETWGILTEINLIDLWRYNFVHADNENSIILDPDSDSFDKDNRWWPWYLSYLWRKNGLESIYSVFSEDNQEVIAQYVINSQHTVTRPFVYGWNDKNWKHQFIVFVPGKGLAQVRPS